MRVLLDECIPRKLKTHLSGHECRTVPEAGWAGKRNGELLALAEGSFDVFLTLDKGVQYQQNLEDLIIRIQACLTALGSIQPGEVVRLGS
jgi:predicted nuclease of predicted toxin-antitoxin system